MPSGVYERTPEHRAKISACQVGKKQTAETRAKISAALTGRKASPETLARMSASRTGKKHTAETRAKMSASHLGMKPSPEARARMSAATIDHSYTRGIPRNVSEEAREAYSENGRRNGSSRAAAARRSESRRLPWVYVTIDGGEIREFDSQAEAARFYGVTGSGIYGWRKRGKCARYLNQGTEGEIAAARNEARRAVRDFEARVETLKSMGTA